MDLDRQLAYSERQNIDTSDSCVTSWFDYGINPEHVNEENMKNNFVEMVNRYGGNIIYILIYFAFTDLKNKFNLRLSNSFCRKVMSKLEDVEHLENKNPYLLILGYWVGNPDKSVNVERFKQASNIINEVQQYKLNPADILRYHGFWINI